VPQDNDGDQLQSSTHIEPQREYNFKQSYCHELAVPVQSMGRWRLGPVSGLAIIGRFSPIGDKLVLLQDEHTFSDWYHPSHRSTITHRTASLQSPS
jgi:hypothetical protein